MSSAVVPSAANKSNENSDSDIEVVKELPSPPRHERNPQRVRNTQNCSYPNNQFHAGNGVGGNNVSVFTGQNPSHPSIQIVNGPYDSSQPATQVNIQMSPIIVNQQQTPTGNLQLVHRQTRPHLPKSGNNPPYLVYQNRGAQMVDPSINTSASSANNAYQSSYNGNTLRHSASVNSSSIVPTSSFSNEQSSADKRKAPPNDHPAAVGKNPVWELAKSLTKWKYTKEEIIRIIRVKGMNCYYAIRPLSSHHSSPAPPPGVLYKCHFYCVEDSKSCNENFSSNMLYMNHIDSHFWKSEHLKVDIQVSTCRECFMRFPNKETLMTHTDFFHSKTVDANGKPYCCHICDYTFNKADIYLRHMFELHEVCETPYVCRVCNYSTSFFTNLISHFRNNHQNSTWFLCRFCLGTFSSPETFCAHIRQHLPRKNNVKCTKCRLIFVKQSSPQCGKEDFTQADHLRWQHQGLMKITQGDMKAIISSGALPNPTAASLENRAVVPVASAGYIAPKPRHEFRLPPSNFMPRRFRAPVPEVRAGSYPAFRATNTSQPPVPRLVNSNWQQNVGPRSVNYTNRPRQLFSNLESMPRGMKDFRIPLATKSHLIVPNSETMGGEASLGNNATPDIVISIKPGWSAFVKFDGGFAKVRGKLKLWKLGLLERCLECGSYISEPNRHFSRLSLCRICDYSTYCPRAAVSHFGHAHGEPKWGPAKESMFTNMDCQLDDDTFNCFCGFETQSGTDMARHVYFCRFGECELPKKGKAISLPQGGTMKHSNEKFSIKSLQHNAVPISSLGKSYTNSAPFTQSPRKPEEISNLPPVPSLVQEPVVKLLNNGNQDPVLGFTNESAFQRNVTDQRLRAPPVLVAQNPPPLFTPSSSTNPPATQFQAANQQPVISQDAQIELSPTFVVDDHVPLPQSPPDDSFDVPTVLPAEAPNMNVLTGKEEKLNFSYDIFKVPVSDRQETRDVADEASAEAVNGNTEPSPLMDAVAVLPADMQSALFGSLNSIDNTLSERVDDASSSFHPTGSPQADLNSQPMTEKSSDTQKPSFGSFLASYMQGDSLKTPPRKKAKKLDAAISTLLLKQNLDDAGPS